MSKITEKKKLQSEIDALARRHVVLSSAKDLNKLLFGELKLSSAGLRPLKSGLYPTSVNALKKIKPSSPLVKLIVEYKNLSTKRPLSAGEKKAQTASKASAKPVVVHSQSVKPSVSRVEKRIVWVMSTEKKIRIETVRIVLTLCVLAIAVFIFHKMSIDYTDNFVDKVETSGESI